VRGSCGQAEEVLVGLPELIVKGPGERGKRKAKMIWAQNI